MSTETTRKEGEEKERGQEGWIFVCCEREICNIMIYAHLIKFILKPSLNEITLFIVILQINILKPSLNLSLYLLPVENIFNTDIEINFF